MSGTRSDVRSDARADARADEGVGGGAGSVTPDFWLSAFHRANSEADEADVDETEDVGTWHDYSGSGGEADSATTWGYTSPKLTAGPAVRFDGTASRVRKINPVPLNEVSGVTLFFAGKIDDAGQACPILCSKNGSSTSGRARLMISDGAATSGTGDFTIGGRRLDADGYQAVRGGTLVTGTDLVLVGVLDYENATCRLYLDGTEIVNAAFQDAGVSQALDSGATMIGTSGGSFFDGDMKHCGVFERALTEAEAVEFSTTLTGLMANPPLTFLNMVHGWWSSPLFGSVTGKLLVGGAADSGGEYIMAEHDTTSKITRRISLGAHGEDDHNVPTVVNMSAGKTLTAYTRHATEALFRYQISGTADDTDWGGELTEATSGTRCTYSQVYVVGTDVWIFYRVGDSSNGSWYFNISADQGATWGTDVELVNAEYMLTYENVAGTEIRCSYTTHPVAGPDPDIYHFIITKATGAVTHPDGTTLGNILTPSGLPVGASEGLRAVDITSGTSRLFAQSEDSDGDDVKIGAEMTGDTDGTYYLYRYAGTSAAYDRHSLGSAGDPLLLGASHYFGGAAMVAGDDKTIYVVRNLRTLVKLTMAADYLSYAEEALATAAEGNKIARPMVHDGYVYYSEFTHYTAYSNFAGDVKRVVK